MKPAAAPGILKGALTAAACLALSGCISLGGKAPDLLFRLTPDESAPVGATVSGKLSDAIVVLDPETDRSLDELRIPVRISDSNLAYLKNAAWIEKPAREFRSLLAETLRAKTGRLVAEGGDYETAGRTVVRGRLLEMGYDVPRGAVVVRFDAVRSEGEGGTAVVKRFEAAVNGVEPKAKYVGPALNQAANEVAQQVAAWVEGE
ncbi:MAG: ABC-type transport auxiliary lipoprotein family protein [Novosphingobium sp.]